MTSLRADPRLAAAIGAQTRKATVQLSGPQSPPLSKPVTFPPPKLSSPPRGSATGILDISKCARPLPSNHYPHQQQQQEQQGQEAGGDNQEAADSGQGTPAAGLPAEPRRSQIKRTQPVPISAPGLRRLPAPRPPPSIPCLCHCRITASSTGHRSQLPLGTLERGPQTYAGPWINSCIIDRAGVYDAPTAVNSWRTVIDSLRPF